MEEKTQGKENKPMVEFRNVRIESHRENGKAVSYPGYMGVVKDESGKEVAFSGCIEGFEAMIWSRAERQETLCRNLGVLLELFLERTLHDYPGIFSKIGEKKFFHN
jgi:hypothetical protein